MKTVLCFGEALVDIFTIGQHVDGPLTLPNYRQYPGGAPANAAVAVAKLGGQAKFIGQVGSDAFGRFLIDALQRYGVDTSLMSMTEQAKTALAFVLLDDDGERSFAFYRDKTADLLFPRDQIDRRWFNADSIVHFCSNTLTDSDMAETTEYAAIIAREAGALLSVDVNLRHNLWPQGHANIEQVNRLLSHAQILKFTREELHYLAGDDEQAYIKALLAAAAQLILITDGKQPVCYHSKHHQGIIKPPSITAVDTTGAGDAFIGSLLFSLSQIEAFDELLKQQSSLEALLFFSVQCGAHTVTRAGAFTAMPAFSDVAHYWKSL